MVTPVTDADIDAFVAANRLAVVDVGAPWCAPCKRLDPIVDELARELAGQVAIGKMNADESPRSSSRFGVLGLPTLLVFKDGKRVAQVSGVRPKDELRALFLQHA